MKTSKYIIFFIIAFILAACSNEDIANTNHVVISNDSIKLVIDANISQQPASRAIQEETKFKYNSTIGIWCTVNGTKYEAYNLRKNNICGEWMHFSGTERQKELGITSDYWRFSYDGNNDITFSTLFISPNTYINGKDTISRNMDIYAYAPFQSGVTDLTKIPYEITPNTKYEDQKDLMYAIQNEEESNKNKSIVINPKIGGNKEATFTFKHAMAAIKVVIKNKNTGEDKGSVSQLDTITIKKKEDGNTPFYTKGTFNAITGGIEGSEQSDSINIVEIQKWISPNNGDSTVAYVLLPPCNYNTDGDYLISFAIDSLHMTSKKNGKIERTFQYGIPKALFKYGDKYVLRAGYTYTLEFTYDNYIHISAIYIDDKWKEDDSIHREY